MNNVAVSFAIMFILIICGFLIGRFFDISMTYYMPFLLWLLALCIFNIFLDKQHVNIYLKDVKDTTAKKDSMTTRAMKTIRAMMPSRVTKTTESSPNINPAPVPS